MKKYTVRFLVGWRGGMVNDETTTIIEAEDFEDAFYKAKNKEWNSDAYAKILGIEELEHKIFENYW